jgi:type VI secretion system secreted protein Hcp
MMVLKALGMAVLVALLTTAVAHAAPEFAVSVSGKVQGAFKGESTRKGFENKFVGLSFDQEAVSPRDVATGQAMAKRVFKPLRITKAWGPASLQLYAALLKNEPLTVTMDFFSIDPGGLLVLDHTIKLSNASVASFRSHSDTDVNSKAPQTDTIELVFQQIEITDHRGKGTVTETWLAP